MRFPRFISIDTALLQNKLGETILAYNPETHSIVESDADIGDMLAADYDADGDGVIDNAAHAATSDAVPWAGVSDKPATFAPDGHSATHASGGADAITISAAQISDLGAQIDAAIVALVDGAPGALDTLAELATALQNNEDAVAALTTAINARLTQAQADALYALLGHTHDASEITGVVAASQLPTATTIVKGAVQFAADGNATAGRAVAADDARLNDARTPTTHAASHAAGGGDALALVAVQISDLGNAATKNVGTTAGTVADGAALSDETARASAAEGVNATAVAAKISTTARGAANGVATLDANGFLTPAQISVFGRIRDGSEFWVSQNFSVTPLGAVTGTSASINVYNPLAGRIAGESNTGTTATGAAIIMFVGVGGTLTARGRITQSMFSEFEVGGYWFLSAASSGTETFQSLCGLTGVHSPNVMPVDLIAFRSENDGSGVRCVCASAGTENVSSVTAIAISAWIKWRIRVTGGSALFYLNDVLVATISTNLPAVAQPLACEVGIVKSAGLTNRAAQWANLWAWGKYV